ncbi:MAG TPA: hypothetical protein VGD01_06380 [Candidatus Elarobacter sp.]
MSRPLASVGMRCAAILLLGTAIFAGCARQSSSDTSSSSTAAAPSPLASGTLPPSPWVVPTDVANAGASPGPSQSDWDDLGWRTFIALNWPAAAPSKSGVSGLPNTQLPIGASSSNKALVPTVWLTYRADSNTMLANAQDPGDWANNPVALPPSCGALSSPTPVSPGFQPMYLDLITKFGTGNVLEASGPPLIDQNGWYVTYDIRLSMSEYTYIHDTGYYNAATQIKAQPNNFVGFPRTGQEPILKPSMPPLAQFGALEVKAAWRVLDPAKDQAVIPRYYTQSGYFLQPDGKTCSGPALFGLIGMHILRLTPTTPATWFWASFEQVDNVTPVPNSSAPPTLATPGTPNGACTSSYNVAPTSPPSNVPWTSGNTPVNVCRVTPIPADVAQSNQTWRGKLSGTVWANYEMIGTINPAPAGASPYPIPPPPTNNTPVNTDTLANTTMETYFQFAHTSCMTCHAGAAPQGVSQPPPTTANQIFTFVLGDAVTPPPSTHALAASAPGARPAHRRAALPPRVLELLRGAGAGRSASPGPAGSPEPVASPSPPP